MLCNCHRCTHVSLYSACYLHWIKLAAWSYCLGYLLRTIYPDGKEINYGDICSIYHFIILPPPPPPPPPPICWIVMSVLRVCIHSCCLITYGCLISPDVLSIVCNQSQNTMCYFLLGGSNIHSELYFLQYAKKLNMFFIFYFYFFSMKIGLRHSG